MAEMRQELVRTLVNGVRNTWVAMMLSKRQASMTKQGGRIPRKECFVVPIAVSERRFKGSRDQRKCSEIFPMFRVCITRCELLRKVDLLQQCKFYLQAGALTLPLIDSFVGMLYFIQ